MTDGQDDPYRDGGVPLHEALKVYVPRELRLRALCAADRCPPLSFEEKVAAKLGEAWFVNSARGVAVEELARAAQAVHDNLISQLESGELIGLVYEEYPIGLDSERKRVPSDLWRSAQLGSGGLVKIHGVTYYDARIWRAGDFEAVADQPQPHDGSAKREADMESKTPQPNNSSARAARECKRWLRDQVAAGPQAKSKGEYRVIATAQFPGLSGRAFDRCWDIATQGHANWGRPGRRRK